MECTRHQWLHDVNIVIVIWFTLELITRFTVCPDRLKFICAGGTVVDFLAIFPFYASLVVGPGNAGTLNAVRVARVVRVLKLTRHSRGLRVIINTLKSSASELLLLVFFLLVVVLVCSSLLYFTEKGEFSSGLQNIAALVQLSYRFKKSRTFF